MSDRKPQTGPVLYRTYPIGTLGLMDDGEGLSRVSLCREDVRPGAGEGETPLTLQAAAELDEYFAGRRKSFTVPLSPKGTEFQLAVWQALRDIPYGQTRTYGEIAAAIGRPRAARAVGMANHDNPLLIFTPCHRVVGKDGSLTGFACGLEAKRRLLELERMDGMAQRSLFKT
ncbi:MAG: methylated-DNA--[protein]-cysteine S-methyltransferase [Clostridiales bacterium]|nr:methylated-DNA--[protein]-cysteine S-methyltransferase [Clostridiales bacterium]